MFPNTGEEILPQHNEFSIINWSFGRLGGGDVLLTQRKHLYSLVRRGFLTVVTGNSFVRASSGNKHNPSSVNKNQKVSSLTKDFDYSHGWKSMTIHETINFLQLQEKNINLDVFNLNPKVFLVIYTDIQNLTPIIATVHPDTVLPHRS